MEAIPDEDLLAIEGDDGRAVAKDGGKRVVTHPNTPARDRMVGNERRLIREHVVGSPGVSNKEGSLNDVTWQGDSHLRRRILQQRKDRLG